MTFRVGQKVVCINDTPRPKGVVFVCAVGLLAVPTGNMGGLTKGRVYTVKSIHHHPVTTCLFLCEIPPRSANDFGFRPDRFRPIVERKTDISIFTSMLHKKKERA